MLLPSSPSLVVRPYNQSRGAHPLITLRRKNVLGEHDVLILSAEDDLFHFILTFAMINVLLAMVGCCVFGARMPELSTVGDALYTLFTGFITGEMPDFSADPLLHPQLPHSDVS